MSFIVTITGEAPVTLAAANWMVALGMALDAAGVDAKLERLACESLPNGTVIARDLVSGQSFVVCPADDFDSPGLPTESVTPFAMGNLPQSVLLDHMGIALRTPLNTVLGYTDLLREQAREQARHWVADDLDKIHRAGEDLSTIIEALIGAWKVEAGHVNSQAESFSLPSLLRDVAFTAEAAVVDAGLVLNVDVPSDLGKIRADPSILRLTIERAIRRAIPRAAGEVALRAYRKGDIISIHIRDDGDTLTVQQLSATFELFAHTGPNRLQHVAHTIELATSRSLIKRMGGDMAVANRSSKGSRITVWLKIK